MNKNDNFQCILITFKLQFILIKFKYAIYFCCYQNGVTRKYDFI